MDGIRQVLGRVKNTFQATETAIFLQYCTLFGCGCTLFPVKGDTVLIASILSRSFALRLNAILFEIKDYGSCQFRIEQVIFG